MKDTSTINPASSHQRGYLGDPSDILHPIRLREAQITVQPVPHVVAIQQTW